MESKIIKKLKYQYENVFFYVYSVFFQPPKLSLTSEALAKVVAKVAVFRLLIHELRLREF